MKFTKSGFLMKKYENLSVSVEEKHFLRGFPTRRHSCPVALALKDWAIGEGIALVSASVVPERIMVAFEEEEEGVFLLSYIPNSDTREMIQAITDTSRKELRNFHPFTAEMRIDPL